MLVAASLGAALDPATAAELREWPIFADLADAQASVVDYLTVATTTDYTVVLTARLRISLPNNSLKLLA